VRPSEIHQFCLTSTRLWGSAISEPSLGLPPLKPQPAYLNASEKGVRINYSRRWPPGRKPTSFLPVLRTSRSDKGPVSEESRSSESRHPQRPSTKTPCAILRLPPCCFSSRDVSSVFTPWEGYPLCLGLFAHLHGDSNRSHRHSRRAAIGAIRTWIPYLWISVHGRCSTTWRIGFQTLRTLPRGLWHHQCSR
jgi:hypothetical protein